jgi:hypothetical protein
MNQWFIKLLFTKSLYSSGDGNNRPDFWGTWKNRPLPIYTKDTEYCYLKNMNSGG